MNIYEKFALIYDELIDDIDYKTWGDFINKILELKDLTPQNTLEMACGTGKLTVELSKFISNIDAFDLSSDMLSIAYNKFKDNRNVRLYNLDMKNFKFNKKYDLDVVNICGSHSLLKHPDFHKWCNDFESYYNEFPFSMIVVDESGKLLSNDSPKVATYHSAKLLADKAEYVILMNAGSFENSLDKFRSQLAFVDSTFLFTKTEFSNRYQIMDWSMGRPSFNGKYKNAEDFREKVALRYLKRTRKGQGARMIDCSAELIEVEKSKIQKEFLRKSSMPQMV